MSGWMRRLVIWPAEKINCERADIDFDEYWQADAETELYHFIGKDIVYFHALFWPAMLHGANLRLPTSIFVHGFLTINGQKMSKSRGTFITAADYLKQLDPEYLRYYLAAKLTPQVEDIDLNFADFCARVNADLVGKFVNLASRCAGFIHKQADGRLADACPTPNYLMNLPLQPASLARVMKTAIIAALSGKSWR